MLTEPLPKVKPWPVMRTSVKTAAAPPNGPPEMSSPAEAQPRPSRLSVMPFSVRLAVAILKVRLGMAAVKFQSPAVLMVNARFASRLFCGRRICSTAVTASR